MKLKQIGTHVGRPLYMYKGNFFHEETDGSINISVGPVKAKAHCLENVSVVFDGLVEELIEEGANPKIRKLIKSTKCEVNMPNPAD